MFFLLCIISDECQYVCQYVACVSMWCVNLWRVSVCETVSVSGLCQCGVCQWRVSVCDGCQCIALMTSLVNMIKLVYKCHLSDAMFF